MEQAVVILLCRLVTNSVEHAELAEQMLEDTYLTQVERQRWRKCLEDHRWAYEAISGVLLDSVLLAAYARASHEPGNPDATPLLTEIERRGIAI